jgi:signal transduction histidine kinase
LAGLAIFALAFDGARSQFADRMAVAEEGLVTRQRSTARLRTTRATRILTTDPNFGWLMRREPSALAGKPLAVFVPIDERSAFRSRVALLPVNGRIDGWRVQLTTPGGIVRVIAQVLASEDPNAAEATLDWVLVADAGGAAASEGPGDVAADGPDMTLSEVAGLLGHELNQPLATIVTYARGAMLRSQSGTLTPEELEQVLTIIVAEAMRVADRLRKLATRDERSA